MTTINYSGTAAREIAARNLMSHLNGIADVKRTQAIIVKSDLIVRKSALKKK